MTFIRELEATVFQEEGIRHLKVYLYDKLFNWCDTSESDKISECYKTGEKLWDVRI